MGAIPREQVRQDGKVLKKKEGKKQRMSEERVTAGETSGMVEPRSQQGLWQFWGDWL